MLNVIVLSVAFELLLR